MFRCKEYIIIVVIWLLIGLLSVISMCVHDMRGEPYDENYFKGENNSICYKNGIVLASDDASELIDAIRNDFKDKHDIMYASINNGVQVIKNNNFSLFVNLNNDKDIEKARIFNSIVNTKNKKLTLTKVI